MLLEGEKWNSMVEIRNLKMEWTEEGRGKWEMSPLQKGRKLFPFAFPVHGNSNTG